MLPFVIYKEKSEKDRTSSKNFRLKCQLHYLIVKTDGIYWEQIRKNKIIKLVHMVAYDNVQNGALYGYPHRDAFCLLEWQRRDRENNCSVELR